MALSEKFEVLARQTEMNLLSPSGDFVIETYDDFESRYRGFGKEIYYRIKQTLPEVFRHFTFYRCLTSQKVDSYAEYESDKLAFCIQLDPLGEVIVLWNQEKQIEIGFWTKDVYNEAIIYIQIQLLR